MESLGVTSQVFTLNSTQSWLHRHESGVTVHANVTVHMDAHSRDVEVKGAVIVKGTWKRFRWHLMMPSESCSSFRDGQAQVRCLWAGMFPLFRIFFHFLKNSMYKFKCRLSVSENVVIKALAEPALSDTRYLSCFWKQWNRCLFVFNPEWLFGYNGWTGVLVLYCILYIVVVFVFVVLWTHESGIK